LAEKKVFLGDFLSTEEEFEAGNNAFSDNGEIRASATGTVLEDSKQRVVSVNATKQVSEAKPGDIVFGRVMLVKDNSVVLAIYMEQEPGKRKVLSHTIASLPIRMVSKDYVERLKDMFKVGDLVKAKIAFAKKFGIDLRTDEPELGVVRGFCLKCKKPLHLFDQGLKCLKCGHSETRKVSGDYSLK